MENDFGEPEKGEPNLFKRWRRAIFPIRPEDTASVRMVKHSAFYLFAVMIILVSAAIALAVMFTL